MQRQIALGMALASALNVLPSRSVAAGCSLATLLILNVDVTDPDGNVVQGLKRSDFSLTEDGKIQTLAGFAFQGPELDPTPKPAGTQQFSYLNHRLFTLLFDFTTMPRNERTRIQDDAIDFIRNDLKPGELLSIETATEGSVETTQDFTDDQTALVAAVNKFRTVDASPAKSGILNAQEMLAGNAAVCGRLQAVPKKSLLYFSTAIEQSQADNQEALDAAANACAKAGVAIYPIGAASAGVAELATKTGGQTFPGRQPAIDEARRESEAYSVLGYYTTNSRHDGTYRKVELHITRPGFEQAKLRYSHGYFADKDLPEPPQSRPVQCF